MFSGFFNRTIDSVGQNRLNQNIAGSPFAKYPRNNCCCATQERKYYSHTYFPRLTNVFIMPIRHVLAGLHGMQPLTRPSFQTKNQQFFSMTRRVLFANTMAAPVPPANSTSLIDCAKQLIGSIANSTFVSAHDHSSDHQRRFHTSKFEVEQQPNKATAYVGACSTSPIACGGQRPQQFAAKYTNPSKFGQTAIQIDAVNALINSKKEELSDGLMDAVASTGKYLSAMSFYFVFENSPPLGQPKKPTNTPAPPTVHNQKLPSATMRSRTPYSAAQASCAFAASSSGYPAGRNDANNNKNKKKNTSDISHESKSLPASCRQLVAECVKLTPATELCAQLAPSSRQRNFSECSDDFIFFLNDDDVSDEQHCHRPDTIDFDVDDESSDSDCFDSADLESDCSADGESDEDDLITSYHYDGGATDCYAKKICVKKVRFDPQPKVHIMHAWNFAYRSARKGQWEDYARDRARFQLRIRRSAAYLDPVLSAEHRRKIYESRFVERNET